MYLLLNFLQTVSEVCGQRMCIYALTCVMYNVHLNNYTIFIRIIQRNPGMNKQCLNPSWSLFSVGGGGRQAKYLLVFWFSENNQNLIIIIKKECRNWSSASTIVGRKYKNIKRFKCKLPANFLPPTRLSWSSSLPPGNEIAFLTTLFWTASNSRSLNLSYSYWTQHGPSSARSLLGSFLDVEMEATYYSETSVGFHETAAHIAEPWRRPLINRFREVWLSGNEGPA
jgi:hypothetical protein